MTQAFNMFMDSYIKKLKRPEMFNFSPDQSYGANLVPGSESQNPWAGRDKANAPYGALGGTQPLQQMLSQSGVSNTPGMVSDNSGGTFNKLMSTITPGAVKYGSDTLANSDIAKKGLEGIKNLFTSPAEMNPALTQAYDVAFKGATPIAEQGGFNFLSGEAAPNAFDRVGSVLSEGVTKPSEVLAGNPTTMIDPTSAALAVVPGITQALTGSKTAGKAMNTAITGGAAAAQGFVNPFSDLAALVSIMRLGGLF